MISTRLEGESYTAQCRRLKYQPHGDGLDDRRGNAKDRKARKLWLLGVTAGRRGAPAPFGGDGDKVACVHCKLMLDYATVTADRINPSGPYTRANIQPACRLCNKARGCDPTWTYTPPADGVAVTPDACEIDHDAAGSEEPCDACGWF